MALPRLQKEIPRFPQNSRVRNIFKKLQFLERHSNCIPSVSLDCFILAHDWPIIISNSINGGRSGLVYVWAFTKHAQIRWIWHTLLDSQNSANLAEIDRSNIFGHSKFQINGNQRMFFWEMFLWQKSVAPQRLEFKQQFFFLSGIGNPGKAWIVIWLIAAAAAAATAAN